MNKITKNFLPDLSASIVVFLVALPLCLGIALGSQTPLFSGIIAGIIGGIVVGTLSNSSLSVSGPAAGLIAIVILGLQTLGSFESLLLAITIAGIIQIIFGFLKFGNFADFIPNSVIKGMLASIGLILIIKQIPHLVGYDKNAEIDEALIGVSKEDTNWTDFFELLNIPNNISEGAILIGAISFIILLIFEISFFRNNKIFKFIPAPLIVVIAGSLINQYFIASDSILALQQNHLVSLPKINNLGELPTILAFPNFSQISNINVWLIALTLAIVASIETLLCIEATDKIDPLKRRTSTNMELKAQGFGNALSGLIGGLPITSVVVRSSANVNANAQSKLSTILHGIWLFLAIILIPDLINTIPFSALAAILILTGYKLTKPTIFKELYRLGHDQLIPFIITIAAILFTNLLIGIFIGIIVSFAFILQSNFKSSLMLVNDGKENYLLRLRKDVSFLNKAKLKNILENLPKNSNVLIDVGRADFIDKDVIEVINDFIKHAHLKKINVEIKKNKFKALHRLIKGSNYKLKVK